jgi:CRISPR system Cascade subunit CasC
MIIELHALQSFAPSNLNRDDTGNPKDALFGGVRRARVSSQSAKRAMRVSDVFKGALGHETPTGTRTKLINNELVERLKKNDVPEQDALDIVAAFIGATFAKPDSKNPRKTSVLVYISQQEFDWIAKQLTAAYLEAPENAAKELVSETKTKFDKQFKNRTSAPDIALFGRMLAEAPTLNIDAACQVAHSLSTHEVTTAEFDYFTAVDDENPDEDTGAAMLGLVAYNSATYYRTLRVDWNQLVSNLGGDTELAARTVEALMQAFALVVPTGMQNSFLNKTAPDFLLAVTRPNNDGQSLVNAFEKPVRAKREGGYVAPSIDALAGYWDRVEAMFRQSDDITLAVLNTHGYELASEELNRATQENLSGWTAVILGALDTGATS